MNDDLHHAIGGTAGWRRLAERFYSGVDRDPILRPLFPGKNHHCAIEEFTAFMVQLFGGPSDGTSDDTQRRWWLSLRESHLRFGIREQERAAWLANMARVLDEAQVGAPIRDALKEFFEKSSAYLVNSGDPIPAGAERVESAAGAMRCEIARNWEGQRGLDEAVAAIRAGDAVRAFAILESSVLRARLERDRSVLAGLLGLMLGSRNPAMLSFVEATVSRDVTLLRERYAARTLMHAASAQGNLRMVELLMRLGADINAHDGGRHTPLYSLANEYRGANGGDVVRTLVRGGANVNAADGVKRCTPLHMAARRGSVEIAGALLDCGAVVDARDSLSDTPLRRAVNCNRIGVASLLISRGADVRSRGNKAMTPLQAARNWKMKELLGGSS